MSTAALYLASNNRHKAEELSAMLGDRFVVRLAQDLVPGITWVESGETFAANALIKAKALRQHTRECILADDSGLMVDALGGAPGVHSSRYAGVDGDDAGNNRKLQAAIAGLPAAALAARFVCTLVFLDTAGVAQVFTGECPGSLIKAPRGGLGFGYDPLFVVPDSGGRTMAELTATEKNSVSHRHHAVSAFVRWLDANPTVWRPRR